MHYILFLIKNQIFYNFLLTYLNFMVKKYFLDDIKHININIKSWDIIFLYGDLASWKTTFSKHIINDLLWVNMDVKSPTYNYYNKYEIPHPNPLLLGEGINCYHFDLYRLKKYDEFFAIGWEEILDNPENISIIEWPEIIWDYFKPTIQIFFKKTNNEKEREIEIKNI